MLERTLATALSATRSEAHAVRFYDDDTLLVAEVAAFAAAAVGAGGAAVLVVTPEHAAALEARLPPASGRLVVIDALATLDALLVEGWPDAQRFDAIIGSVVAAAASHSGPVHAFGEMVSLLCEDGRPDAAVRLEQLWNALAARHAFTLLCGYRRGIFADGANAAALSHICSEHTHVCLEELVQPRRDGPAPAQTRRAVAPAKRDEFLARLSHELRNPLAPIVTALQIMRLRGDHATAGERAIIERHVERIVSLTDEMLDGERRPRGRTGDDAASDDARSRHEAPP